MADKSTATITIRLYWLLRGRRVAVVLVRSPYDWQLHLHLLGWGAAIRLPFLRP
jgi:hypothetical protein